LEASNILIGVVGKTNVGKSTFFAAATELSVQIENRPFTTIDPNLGVGYVRKKCVHVKLGLPRCDASNSVCLDGDRMIPVKMMDVAGLVPGAHRGRGLGNKFLDDLRKADVLLLVVDASGSTDPEGNPVKPGTYDPAEEVKQMLMEIDEWMFSIISKDWDRFARHVDTGGVLDIPGAIAERMSGLGIRKHHVVRALEASDLTDKPLTKWSREELKLFTHELRKAAKPIIIVANKVDIPEAEDGVKRLREELPDYPIVPASAAAELALRRAARAGWIRYKPGDPDFEIIDESKLNHRARELLEAIRERVLRKWGSTGVQQAINKAVLDVLGMIAVYPVEDHNKYTDRKGRILPDVVLVPRGTTVRELAYKIHTDLGRTFLYAIHAVTKQRIGESYVLKDDDVIKIVAAAARG
jgi:ribosome-binding ATPase YchF (GTP1/OBG family)